MKLALVTIRPKISNIKSNLQKIEKYIKKTKADIYVFGEMSITGYPLKDELIDYAVKKNGDIIKKIKNLAKDNKAYIIVGLPTKDEKVQGLIYNSAILVHPNGKVDIYNKWFLPTFGPFEEKIFFNEGENLIISETKFGKIGLLICYDIFFPEICKAYTLLGCNLIICISASPSITRKYFETLIPARAIENTVFFVFTNIVGTQENLVFWGGSQVYDPLANEIIKAPYYKESIVTCEINLKDIEKARVNRPVLRDVRPVIYNDLYDISRKRKITRKK
jgi:predicted amidohydrolase